MVFTTYYSISKNDLGSILNGCPAAIGSQVLSREQLGITANYLQFLEAKSLAQDRNSHAQNSD